MRRFDCGAKVFALALGCAVVSGGVENAKITFHGIDRAHLSAGADDATMSEIPLETGTLFMLRASNVSPQGLKQLARLRQLSFLRLNHSVHGDAAVKALSDHPALTKLMMWSVEGLSADGIAELSSVGTLRSLDFSRVALSSSAWRVMPTQLEQLGISRSELGDQGLAALPTFPKLKTFTLKGDERITHAGLAAFVKRHPHLQALSIDAASAKALDSLADLSELKSLWLGGLPESEAAWRAIGQLAGLERLWISADVSEVSRRQVAQLKNPRLQYVDFHGQYVRLRRGKSAH